MIFQQFCGMKALMAEMASIIQETGLSIDGNLQSALSTSTQFVSVLVSAFNMDSFGRRKMWVFSTCGIVVSLIIYTLSLTLNIFNLHQIPKYKQLLIKHLQFPILKALHFHLISPKFVEDLFTVAKIFVKL